MRSAVEPDPTTPASYRFQRQQSKAQGKGLGMANKCAPWTFRTEHEQKLGLLSILGQLAQLCAAAELAKPRAYAVP